MTKQVLAVIGDYYHATEGIEQTLSEAFVSLSTSGYSLQIISQDTLSTALQSKPAAVVIYQENRMTPQMEDPGLWLTPAVENKIVQYVESGGSWFAWHAGMASYPETGSYTDMLRGYFDWHPKNNALVHYTPVGKLDSQHHECHPIIEGVQPFEFIDEHYFVHLRPEETTVFLTAKSIDGQSAAGWAHPFGQGRVCCITPAHHKAGLLDAQMQVLLTRVLRWCVRLL